MFQLFKFTNAYGLVPKDDSLDEKPSTEPTAALVLDNMNGDFELSVLNHGHTESNIISPRVKYSPLFSSSSVIVITSLSDNDISVIANTMNALLGVSIFAMPWGYLQSGMLGGSIMILIIGMLSFETARVLLVAQKALYDKTGDIKGYPEIASLTLGGPIWSSVVQIATALSCIGGCIGYLIFLGQTVGQLFSISFSTSIYFATIPLILLSWVRSFRNLSLFTITSVLSIVLAVFAIIYDGTEQMKGSIEDAPLFLPLPSTLKFLGPATFLFTVHYCVLSMGAETLHDKIGLPPSWSQSHVNIVALDAEPLVLSDPEQQSSSSSLLQQQQHHQEEVAVVRPVASMLIKPLIIAYILSIFLIALLGGGGFLTYRHAEIVRDHEGIPEPGCLDHVCQNVILNLSPGLLRAFVGFSLVISIVTSYIVILAPAREHIELGILKYLYPTTYLGKHDTEMNTIRAALVIFTAIVALVMPFFGSMIGAVGGLTDALQSFVLPPLIFLKTEEGRLSRWQQIFYRLIFFWGLCTIIYTIGNIVQTMASIP